MGRSNLILSARLNGRQQTLLAGFFANLAIVFVGLGLTDQPVVNHDMTINVRGGMMILGFGFLLMGMRVEGESGRER